MKKYTFKFQVDAKDFIRETLEECLPYLEVFFYDRKLIS